MHCMDLFHHLSYYFNTRNKHAGNTWPLFSFFRTAIKGADLCNPCFQLPLLILALFLPSNWSLSRILQSNELLLVCLTEKMSISFKFRSCSDFDSVDIDGRTSISLGELKIRIARLKNLNVGRDFDLILSDATSGKGQSISFFFLLFHFYAHRLLLVNYTCASVSVDTHICFWTSFY